MEPANLFDQFASFGAAGLMGAMWLWERRSSARREQQLDESHARIVTDAAKIDALVELIRQNTQAMTRLATLLENPERPT